MEDGGATRLHECDSGPFGEASDARVTPVHGVATLELGVGDGNEITALETTLAVPVMPSPIGTSFIWPGLQPSPSAGGPGAGVLQTVLTFGPTCAPHAPADPYASWWVSPEYVNPDVDAGRNPGCQGGEGIAVAEGVALHLVIRKRGSAWTESINDQGTGRTESFDFDLGGQTQRRALFAIERRDGASPTSAVFTETRITFAQPEPAACQPAARGVRDTFSVPRASVDGRTCCIDRVELVGDDAR